MKLKLGFFVLFLALMASLSSCKNELFEGRLQINPSPSEQIEASSQSSDLRFEVQTDYPTWVSSANVEWLSLTQESNALLIHINANPYPTIRTAQVVIVAGGLSETITVVQQGNDSPFVVKSDHIFINQWGDEGDIHVDTYLRDWTVESNAEWLKATAMPHEARIVVVVDPFEEEGRRVGTLTISASTGISSTITIEQTGKERYIMPIFAWGKDINGIIATERGRRNTLVSVPSPPTALSSEPYRYYSFKTKNELFPQIHYETMNLSDQFVFRAVLAAKSAETLRSEDYIAYLKSQGFEPEIVATSNAKTFTHTYINKGLKIRASLQVDKNGQRVFFFPVIEQPGSMPTINTLDLGNLDFHEATPEDISNWEKARQSVYDAIQSSTESKKAGRVIEIYHAMAPFYLHTYIFDQKPSSEEPGKVDNYLAQSSHILDNLSYVYHKWGDLYLVTREFSDLLEREGFQLVEYDSYTYLYLNRERQLLLWFTTNYWRDGQRPSFNVIPLY
ncbi:MAG: BACON domain-containing protein [Bacteroidales bacterium]|uniref:BACON domain-containing protein n=1 Tax=Porphyromonas sp. TaxID=1924944 RepID=UPI00297B926F|nr:BACON domain-containing protein [Porphyromonas sp.]MDD7438893.1 BACON domain-containing protein [Bacteroidales bacterium]MDY3067217.1 BACON domain-containing protein [Porphyromonas sp.]